LANQFVAEAKARHQTAFFEPEDGTEGPAANAVMRSAKLAAVESHHLRTHFAFRCTHGAVLIARRRCVFLVGSLMYVSIRSEYVSLWMFLTQASGNVTSVAKLLLWF
jgi:hypothetical protein